MPKSLDQIAREVASRYNLPYEYIRGLIQYESKGDPNAVSPTGARGLAQFTGTTGRQYGLNRRNAFDPESNVDAAGRFARDNFQSFQRRMGRDPTPEELYLTHLQGAGGATSGLKRPDDLAVDVFGERNVRVNLPASQRARLNEITAREFQDIHKSNISRAMKPFKGETIDIGDQPTLNTLQPPRPQTQKQPDAANQLLMNMRQESPTESSMARPSVQDAIRQSMDELGIRDLRSQLMYAGFVPPGLTRGAAKTRDAANRGVMPKGTIKDAESAAKRAEDAGPYDRAAPGTRGMEGSYADYVAKEKARMRGEAGKAGEGGGAPPTPPADPNLAAQNDPGGNLGRALAARARGGPPAGPGAAAEEPYTINRGRTSATVGGTVAAGVGAQVAAPDINREKKGDQEVPGIPRRAAYPEQSWANQAIEQQLGLPPGTLASPFVQSGLQKIAPVIQEAMKDPQTAAAAVTAAKGVVGAKARQDAVAAEVQRDPTYYQRLAAQRGGSGDPIADRMMEIAVARDYQNPYRGPAVGRQPVQRGVQNAPPPAAGEEKGESMPPPVGRQAAAPQGGLPIPPSVPVQTTRIPPSEYSATPEGQPNVASGPVAMDPGYGMTQPYMDPVMMQLMQYFTGGGGGGGGFEGP